MSAPKRTTHQSIRHALQEHSGIRWELDRLEKAANTRIRKTLPRFRYQPGEVAKAFLDDLAEVVCRNDWRSPLEGTARRLRRAAKYISEAVRLVLGAANGSPTYAGIPSIVWESTRDAEAERQRIATLSAEDRLFGSGGAIESLRERKARRVIDPRKVAPDFLRAMLVYAARCQREAGCLDNILKARDRRYDRLGPILNLIHDVQGFTGKPHDAAVARLLTDAFEIAGSSKQFSPDAIRKIRQHHLSLR